MTKAEKIYRWAAIFMSGAGWAVAGIVWLMRG